MSGIITNPEHIKVFILYLLHKVGYAVPYNDLATIVIRDGYVDYFDFVTNFHELLGRGLIVKAQTDGGEQDEEKPADRESYTVSSKGKLIAKEYASDVLLDSIREKSYISAMRHLSLEKRGAVINHNVEQTGDGYIFHCSVKDKDGVAFDLSVRADSYSQVSKMVSNFEDRPDVIYRGIVSVITGNVNFLME